MAVLDAITNRRSHRSFTGEPLSQETLQILVDAACAAPVAMGDYQSIHLSVVQDQQLQELIENQARQVAPNMREHPTYQAPVLLVISVRPDEQRPAAPYCNAACMAQNILVQATEMGLGSVFILSVALCIQEATELHAKLGIPEGFVPAVIVSVGHPAAGTLSERAGKAEVTWC